MKIPGLAEKGKYSSLLGLLIGVIVTIFVIIDYSKGALPINAVIFYALYGISMAFIVLPSKVSINVGKFSATMED